MSDDIKTIGKKEKELLDELKALIKEYELTLILYKIELPPKGGVDAWTGSSLLSFIYNNLDRQMGGDLDKTVLCPMCGGSGISSSVYICAACYNGRVKVRNLDRLFCVSCRHSESSHFEGSYNKKAKRGTYSECGVELQFVCGCKSFEFKRLRDWND